MLRVIAGSARSLKLKTPSGMDTRPTTDRIKETLFNMLQTDVADAVFIDLFSGSGAIGIEALSRGARKGYFVDNNTEAINCIRENVTFTKFESKAVILKQDCFTALNQITEKQADLIFMDPPYGKQYEQKALELLRDKPYVTDETLIIIEAGLDTELVNLEELGFEITKVKKYKTNKHFFVKKN